LRFNHLLQRHLAERLNGKRIQPRAQEGCLLCRR
jgi:hypothetical protein